MGNMLVTWDATLYTAPNVEALNFTNQGILFASANAGSGRVLVFNQDGTFVKNMVDAPEYSNLGNVNFTLGGHVIVADYSALGRGIRELDQNTGAVLATFGEEAGLLQEDMIVDGVGVVVPARRALLGLLGAVFARIALRVIPSAVWENHRKRRIGCRRRPQGSEMAVCSR